MKDKKHGQNKLQHERLSRGWKQEEVAEKLGVDVRTIRRWESGHAVRPINIAGLTQLFEKSAEELEIVEENQPETSREFNLLPIENLFEPMQAADTQRDNDTSRTQKPPIRPGTLPFQVTPLIGREEEITTVKYLLCHQDIRLLTLTGPGGTG